MISYKKKGNECINENIETSNDLESGTYKGQERVEEWFRKQFLNDIWHTL